MALLALIIRCCDLGFYVQLSMPKTKGSSTLLLEIISSNTRASLSVHIAYGIHCVQIKEFVVQIRVLKLDQFICEHCI